MSEREQPSTALKQMPHYTTWGGTYVTRPVAREDRSPIQSDGDFNNVVFHSKQADGFMKLGDIKGEIVRSDGDEIINNGGGQNNLNAVTWREDGAGRFTTGGGGDSSINNGGHFEMQGGIDLRSDKRFVFEPLEAMTSLGESNDSGLDADGGFLPREVSAVEIGRPPDPKMWLHLLG